MPAPTPHTIARILKAGKQEFLENGYEKASLRRIAAAADVTTGAIYGYCKDKAALFDALVAAPAKRLMDAFEAKFTAFKETSAHDQLEFMHAYTPDSMDWMLDIIYEDFDAYYLILCCAGGTKYEHFLDRLIAYEETYTLRFMNQLREQGYPVRDLPRAAAHLLCSACYEGAFQVVEHRMSREEASANLRSLVEFFYAGWSRIMGLS